MEGAKREVMEEDHTEEVDSMEEDTNQLLAILDTPVKEVLATLLVVIRLKEEDTQETTLRHLNKPLQFLQDLLRTVAVCSATAVAPRKLFSSASTTSGNGESCAAASTMWRTSRT